MNDLQIFDNEEFGRIRTVEKNGQVWFCGADVANALEYKNSRDAISRHCKEGGVAKHDIPTSSGIQSIVFINEPNLYRLITHSKLSSAERFEKWVFEEVLPALRKTGTYSMKPEQGDILEVLRLIGEWTPEKLPYIGTVLDALGYAVADKPKAEPSIHTGRTFCNTGNVEEFISGEKVSGRPTHDVYEEYKAYCHNNGIEPIPHVVFSKVVHQVTGSEIIYRRISGKTRRVFK